MLRFIFNSALALLILSVLIVSVAIGYLLPDLPNIDTLKNTKLQEPLRIYSANLSLLAEFGEKRRVPVAIEAIPEKMIKAFLAAEDDLFYSHPGVDWQGIARAAFTLITTGTKKQGGSTITMQVARNFFLSQEKTYLRKAQEILLALKIENQLSKNEILALYLNKIYLGQRAYGVAAAAEVYYGSDLKSLTLSQIAMIAGLPKAPSTTNPITAPEKALVRRQYVLARMLALSFITEQEYNTANNAPISAVHHEPSIVLEAPYIAEMVRLQLLKKYGKAAYSDGLKVKTTIIDRYQNAAQQALIDALHAYDVRHGYRGAEAQLDFTNDKNNQELAALLSDFPILANLYPAIVTEVDEQSISVYMKNLGNIKINWEGLKWARKYISVNRRGPAPETASDIVTVGDVIRLIETETGGWLLSQVPNVEGAIVSIDANNGKTFALVGGFDFNKNKFNRITQAKRQPGSSFKPFIYSAALAAGKTAATIINDAPVVIDNPSIKDKWRPQNYSKKNYGPTSLRKALTHSRNLVSIRLLDLIGLDFTLAHLEKFGFDSKQLPYGLSLALGTGEVTPWQLIKGYSVFANGGFLIEPHYIEEITASDTLVFTANHPIVCTECTTATVDSATVVNAPTPLPTNQAPQVVDARNIWIMNSITRDVIQQGTGRRARQLNRNDLSGKTGTTNQQRDTWFAGFNKNIVTISWIGFDTFSPLGKNETGASTALPMWMDYMAVALDGMPESIIKKPKEIINILIDPATGEATGTNNPNAVFEVFRVEHAPKLRGKQGQTTSETNDLELF